MALAIPRTWKLCKDNTINQIYNEVWDEAVSLGLISGDKYKRPLYVNKSVRYWGLCRSHKTYTSSDFTWDSAIWINEKIVLAKSYDTARKVIVHELTHAALPTEHHSYLWKARGDKLGKKWGITVQRTDSYEGLQLKDDDTVKYIVECPECHTQWKRDRMCKLVERPERYRCAKCKKDLIRIK